MKLGDCGALTSLLCSGSRLPNIKPAFKYRTWLSEDDMQNCGADVYQRGLPGTVEIKFETLTRKLKPVTINKSRGTSAPFGNM